MLKVTYNFEQKVVRALRSDGEVYFSIYDVAYALEFRQPRKAIFSLVIEKRISDKEMLNVDGVIYGSLDFIYIMTKASLKEELARRFMGWFVETYSTIKGINHTEPEESDQMAPEHPDELFTITQIAKRYGLTAKSLNEILHNEGVQFKVRKQWVLYSQYQGKGLTATIPFTKPNGEQVLHTYWTKLGVNFIHAVLIRKQLIEIPDEFAVQLELFD